MEALHVQAALLARGTKLSPPASPVELRELANVEGVYLDGCISKIYSIFNGFENYDQKSQINLWSIERVIREAALVSVFDGQKYSAFGDFLVESDFIMWCPGDENLPVYLLYERRELAASVSSFMEKLGAGAFDFVGSSNSGT